MKPPPRLLRFAGLCCVAIAMLPSMSLAKTLRVDLTQSANDRDTFHTIAAALEHLKAGDTLVIGAGEYREAIDLRLAPLKEAHEGSAQATRIEAAGGASPLIKGSDVVRDWQPVRGDVFAKKGWPINSQQVFIDGKPLKQIGGSIFGGFPTNPKHQFATLHQAQGGIWPGRIRGALDDLTDDSFYYDEEARILYVRSSRDPRRHLVEVSARPYLVIGEALNNVEIRGLHFAHANTTSVAQSGAIAMTGKKIRLTSVHVIDVDGAGMDLTGDQIVVERSVANRCGMVGMKVRGRGAKLVDNETSFNNTRGFNKWWEAGGAKFVGAGGLQDSEVIGHRAFGNAGDGLWFDWHNDNNRVHGVVSAYNSGMGIHYEASSRAYIYDSYAYANGQRGIYLANSSQSIVAHNLVAANGMEGIAIVDDRNAALKGPKDLVPIGNRVAANIVAWNGKAALILPESSDNRSDDNFFVGESPAFSRGWPTREQPLSVGLSAWQETSGGDRHSKQKSAPMPPELQDKIKDERPNQVEPVERDARVRQVSAPSLWNDLLNDAKTMATPSSGEVPTEFSSSGAPPGPRQ